MGLDTYYKDHWLEIEPERLERYEKMFQWGQAYDGLLEPARIEPGQTVADFGCGPGAMVVELARLVGEEGHVHALDINAEFVARTRKKVESEGLSSHVTVHHLTGERLPFEDDSLHALVTKNVMVYLDDALATFKEFKRVVRAGGRVHAIDSDWQTTIVEPVPLDQWRAFLGAGSHAYRNPIIGRQMYGLARKAGFSDLQVRVVVSPDTKGRFANVVQNIAGYAREADTLSETEIQKVLQIVEDSLNEGTYLAINPQFMVTATV